MKNVSRLSRWLITCFFIIFFIPLNAQEKIKFGKIDPADLKMTVCPFDSSADAMVLGDVGESYFTYDDQEGFVMMFERHLRIKIFTKNGYHETNIEIPYFHTEQDRERIISLKGRTYNLEGGKVIEKNLEDESVFDEEVDAYWKNRKITFPAVKEGSVVELRYTIRSPFLANLRDWYFQRTIPVKWSEYQVSIPEFFHYSRQASGYANFCVNENSSTPKHINQLQMNRGGDQYQVTHSVSTASLDYTDFITRVASNNIPAFREEPYTSSIINYVAKIEYVYNGYQLPHEAAHTVNSSWEEIVETLGKDEDFGQQINKGGLVKEIVNEINAKAKEPMEKMLLAHEYIKMNMKWNDYNSKYPTFNLRKALQGKTGNSADINLSLVLLLRELGLSANPVILSTRDHGLVIKAQPSIKKMNYVIACVSIDGKDYLLDATSRLKPYNMLPVQCLNGEGLVVSRDAMRWIPLLQEEKDNTVYFADMRINPDGEINGKLEVSLSGYPGAVSRNRFHREGEENYKKTLRENLNNWTLDSISWKNMDNIRESLNTLYHLSSTEIAESGGNMIYLNVLLNMGQKLNPFRQEKRNYPVDFGCPLKDSYVFTYEIPEGFLVESLPEAMNIALPDQGGTFKFIAGVTGNKISISSKLSINKVFFTQPEYEVLREFFNQITTKHAQQIVLKKA